ncbi:hypothetical protein DRQ07_04840 [candidate division KSB1 bacterium]|nr:MAG: hypothetical protein DRQ07_04840 [candidate division KSB1 bacterium]
MKVFNDERGFWSAYVLIFVVTLALMGMGAAMLIRNEGVSISKTAEKIQADYAAESGVYFGINAIEKGTLTEDDNQISLNYGNTYSSISLIDDNGQEKLRVESSNGNSSTTIYVNVSTGSLADQGIISAGSISNITALDESGNTDNTLLVPGADMPTIDVNALRSLAQSQSHDPTGATFSPPDGYCGSFINSSTGEVNVTYVTGNLSVGYGRTVYGIFVVEGSVTLSSRSDVQGVIYCINSNSVTMNRSLFFPSVRVHGGVVANGDVVGSGLGNVTIQHNSTYMEAFESFKIGGGGNVTFGNWEYQ